MIKGSEIRKADYSIEAILLDRWSPRAMSGEEISEEELMRLFEAARWAPSSLTPSNGARFKASSRVWWCMGCKASITSVRERNCASPMNFKWKRWLLSANRDRKNGCL